MKLSLRNLAMGTALAVSSLAFAQEMPFTVTTDFARLVKGEDFGLPALGGDMRVASGYNGTLYSLDKGSGKIWAITGDNISLFAQVDPTIQNEAGEALATLSTAITTDDAGNILVLYGKGGGWYNSTARAAIVAANGQDVTYAEITFPEGLAPTRMDVAGRIVGDMLSEDGGYMYIPGKGGATACFNIVGGEFIAEEYPSAPAFAEGGTPGLNYAFPMYSTYDEFIEADPLYNACGFAPWAAAGINAIVDNQLVTYTFGMEQGVSTNSIPGGDVITYEGNTYYLAHVATGDTKDVRNGSFAIYDAEGTVLYTFDGSEVLGGLVTTGSFINGGGLFAHKVPGKDNVFSIQWWSGFNQGAVAASLTLTFPVSEPETPWTETGAFNIRPMYNRTLTNDDFGAGVTLGNSLRCATGYNGVIYALDKETGKVYSITGTEVKEFAQLEVNHGENNDHVSTGITTDDAGNIIVGYANGDFFANAIRSLAIIPAGGGDVIYTEPLEFPEGFSVGRSDVFGRIVGNVLSEEGAYFFIGGGASGNKAACFYASNGEFVAEEYPSDDYASPLSSSNVVVPPFSTFDEVAECDPLYNAGVMTPWNQYGPEVIVDATAQKVGRPEGLAYAAIPGADLFTYEGKTYYVIPYTRVENKRSGDFVIYDEDLNILFKTDNTVTDANISGGYLNGGALVVHPVEGSANKFILSFWGGPTTCVMAASYEIEFPAVVPPSPAYPEQLYVVGAMADWASPEASNAAAYENYILHATADGVYNATVTVPLGKAQFRFFETLGGWDAPQYGIAAEDKPVDITFTDGVYNGNLVAGKGSINVPTWLGGTMDITVSLVDNTVSIKANEQFVAGDLYIRGEFNGWGTENKFDGPVEKDGKYVYTTTLAAMPAGEFKIADNQWGADWGATAEAPAFDNGITYPVLFKGDNLNFPAVEQENVTVEFVLSQDLSAELTMSWEGIKPARNNYAYGIVMTDNGDGKYVIDFKSTGDATATLIVTGDEGEQKFEIGAVKAGDNTYEFDASQLPEGKEYTFAIALNNDTFATAPALVYTAPQFELATRGGMVVINDTESDAFGMAVACAGKAQGIQLIDQNLEALGIYHAGFQAWNPANQSSPFRGAEREGLAVFGDYSDAGANYYVFDPMNPEELTTMLGEPAVKNSDGLWTLDGVEIAGGNSGLAFVGKGENTRLYTIIEDNTEHPNCLAYYNIGTASMITEAPAAWLTEANAPLLNHNVEMAPAANGMYIAQIRSNADESSVCRMLYMDYEGQVMDLWYNDVITTCAGGVAITADEETLAVATQSEILFFEVMMDEATNTPELMPIKEWTIPMASSFSELRFDIAGNLYVYCRDNKGVQVYACPMGQDAVTAAKAQYVIKGIGSGVEGVAVDAVDAEAVYYTVGGVRIAAEDLTPGVYVKVVGNTATKVIVK